VTCDCRIDRNGTVSWRFNPSPSRVRYALLPLTLAHYPSPSPCLGCLHRREMTYLTLSWQQCLQPPSSGDCSAHPMQVLPYLSLRSLSHLYPSSGSVLSRSPPCLPSIPLPISSHLTLLAFITSLRVTGSWDTASLYAVWTEVSSRTGYVV
jgi:hypothetical protein